MRYLLIALVLLTNVAAKAPPPIKKSDTFYNPRLPIQLHSGRTQKEELKFLFQSLVVQSFAAPVPEASRNRWGLIGSTVLRESNPTIVKWNKNWKYLPRGTMLVKVTFKWCLELHDDPRPKGREFVTDVYWDRRMMETPSFYYDHDKKQYRLGSKVLDPKDGIAEEDKLLGGCRGGRCAGGGCRGGVCIPGMLLNGVNAMAMNGGLNMGGVGGLNMGGGINSANMNGANLFEK